MRRPLLFLALMVTVSSSQAQEEYDDTDRTHTRIEYLYWYLRKLDVPPILTAGPTGSTASLNEPGTTILRGGDRIESRHDRYIGIRAQADWWFGDCNNVGVEADVFFLERDSTHFTVRHGQVPVLAIPFTDSAMGNQTSFVVNGFNPEFGNLFGGTRIYSRMELFGQEGNFLLNLMRDEEIHLDLILGTRFLQMRERLDLTSNARILPDQTTVIGLEDHIQTFDKFFGGQVGAKGQWKRGRWTLEGKAAVALGGNDQLIRNKGFTTVHSPESRQVTDVGLFVQPSNRGTFDRWSFDVVTELRANVGFDVSRHLRVITGYSLLTWNGLVRPGNQIQPTSRAGGTPRPNFQEDFFWAQGGNVGLEVRW